MSEQPQAKPRPTLTIIEAVAVIVGIVVGVGIFKTPTLVANNVSNGISFLLIWLLGGLISLLGALCYGELATAYPHPGGEYHYLKLSFGREIALLFAWARLTVMQTGSIALLAFVFGDYCSQLVPLGEQANSIYAAVAVIILTGINALGIQPSKWIQNWLTTVKLVGLLFIVWTGLAVTFSFTPAVSATSNPEGSYGSALIFVLLTYGGWSEAAYLSAEIQNVQRNMVALP